MYDITPSYALQLLSSSSVSPDHRCELSCTLIKCIRMIRCKLQYRFEFFMSVRPMLRKALLLSQTCVAVRMIAPSAPSGSCTSESCGIAVDECSTGGDLTLASTDGNKYILRYKTAKNKGCYVGPKVIESVSPAIFCVATIPFTDANFPEDQTFEASIESYVRTKTYINCPLRTT